MATCLCCGRAALNGGLANGEWCGACFPCVPSVGMRGPDCPLDELLRAPAVGADAPVVSLGRARRRKMIAASAERLRRRREKHEAIVSRHDDASDEETNGLPDWAE